MAGTRYGSPPEWPLRPEPSRPRHARREEPRTLRTVFRRADAHPRNWLLLIPIVLPLIPTLYNRIEPTFLGLPFFYWSQLGFAFLASAVIAYVHLRDR